MDTSPIWAKSGNDTTGGHHPLLLHMVDVACSVDAILDREPEVTRERMGACLGLPWDQARPWILLIAACHDLGKACPGFQAKWPAGRYALEAVGLRFPPGLSTKVHHAWVSQIILSNELVHLGWPQGLADLTADAVGCHHGKRAGASRLSHLEGDRHIWQDAAWCQARSALFTALLGLWSPGKAPCDVSLSGPDFMLLSGLVSFADWIGSSEAHFPFGNPADCQDLEAWRLARKAAAEQALDAIGWGQRTSLLPKDLQFKDVFEFGPRPLQEAVAQEVASVSGPCVMLVEAPMGERERWDHFLA